MRYYPFGDYLCYFDGCFSVVYSDELWAYLESSLEVCLITWYKMFFPPSCESIPEKNSDFVFLVCFISWEWTEARYYRYSESCVTAPIVFVFYLWSWDDCSDECNIVDIHRVKGKSGKEWENDSQDIRKQVFLLPSHLLRAISEVLIQVLASNAYLFCLSGRIQLYIIIDNLQYDFIILHSFLFR